MVNFDLNLSRPAFVGAAVLVSFLLGCIEGERPPNQNDAHAGEETAMKRPQAELLAQELDETHPTLRNMTRLNSREISAAVIGHTLIPVQQPSLPQGETFLPGGNLFVQLDRIRVRGTYQVVADALCIDVDVHPGASCRALYRGENGRVYQLFFGSNNVPIEITIR